MIDRIVIDLPAAFYRELAKRQLKEIDKLMQDWKQYTANMVVLTKRSYWTLIAVMFAFGCFVERLMHAVT